MSSFYCEYDLKNVNLSNNVPANHQKEALAKLKEWFNKQHANSSGGILALPTGGGKTFTARRFLCSSLFHDTCDGPLSKGYKVLWLAHTQHLLEQAFFSFVSEVGRISEQRKQLNVRVVSPGHYPVHSIKPSDDVVIITLQTLRGAYNRQHPSLEPFLNAAGDKLFVVFDEAHHAPANSYRKLLLSLRDRFHNKMWLLGLTATPTYTDENKRGWLKELFPQEVLYPENGKNLSDELIAERILAKPEFEQHRTNFDINFDEQEYRRWVNTYSDLPEEIIQKLAENEERTRFIAKTYIEHQTRYGQTIIFADRWYQCEALCQFLREGGVNAGAIFTKVDNRPGGVLAIHKKVLEQFRNGELQVLVNIQMLTEGTDVPNAQTVFLTRQTTSSILLTQMIGRALRGSQFGGTDKAYIVSFIDNWKQTINWGKPDFSGDKNEQKVKYGKQPNWELISIELVRRWAEQVSKRDRGIPLNIDPFVSLLPLGWYLIEFQTLVSDSEDEEFRQLLLVFDNEKKSYEKFVQSFAGKNLQEFAEIDVVFESKLDQLEVWKQEFFHNSEEYIGGSILTNMFNIARHIAQNDGKPPKWFNFEQRQEHDLDALAQNLINERLDRILENQNLKTEYENPDRYWSVIYSNYHRFKEQYDECANRILNHIESPTPPPPSPPDADILDNHTKQEVKKRDGYRCLCCTETRKDKLVVDHIKPRYYGGTHSLDNLQTLCSTCNSIKGTETINFRNYQTPLNAPPSECLEVRFPLGENEKSIRRSINFFYRAAAVETVKCDETLYYCYNWEISLYENNNPRWVIPYLEKLVKEIRSNTEYSRQNRIIITAPGFDVVAPINGYFP